MSFVPLAVAAYNPATYWFTAATSFANLAVVRMVASCGNHSRVFGDANYRCELRDLGI
jgi:hypothetical protein